MTSPLLPPAWIEAPAPAPLPYGLFSAAIGPMEMADPHWVPGVEYQSEDCGIARLYQAVCDTTPQVKVFDDSTATTKGLPFVAYSSLSCGSQTYDFATMQARNERKLAGREQQLAEAMLWGDVVGDTISYFHAGAPATNITVTNLGAAANTVQAVSMLEQQLATCYGHPGLIHARPRMAAYLASQHQNARWDGTVWRSMAGNTFVFGTGYSGLGPAADPPTATTEWMYATGRVAIWRNAVQTPDPRQTFDRSVNQYRIISERNYVVAVECCIAAVEVTLP